MDRDKFDSMMSQSAPEPEPVQGNLMIGFDVVEVQRVGLQPGDVLMVTVKNDDMDQDSVDGLRKQLNMIFPNNKVFVFAMRTVDDVKLSVVTPADPQYDKVNKPNPDGSPTNGS